MKKVFISAAMVAMLLVAASCGNNASKKAECGECTECTECAAQKDSCCCKDGECCKECCEKCGEGCEGKCDGACQNCQNCEKSE